MRGWPQRTAGCVVLGAMLALWPLAPAKAQGPDDIAALNKQVAQLYAQGKHAEAVAVAKRQLELADRLLGPNHPGTLAVVYNLADLYRAGDRYAEAEPLYLRVLAALEAKLGQEHPDTLVIVNSLAAVYFAQGRYADAEPHFRRIHVTLERALGPDHPNTITSANNLAEALRIQGRYAEAEPIYRRAVEVQERVLGREHPDTLGTVGNLASLFFGQGKYVEAEPLFRHVLNGQERVLGREHPRTLASVENLGTVYYTQGRFDEAEPLFRRTVEARERLLGPEHPQTISSVNNLAELYHALGRYAEAEPLLRRALIARTQALGQEHPDTITSVNNLGAVCYAQGRYDEAEPLYRRAIEARERVLGKEHASTLSSVNNLALLYDAQGRYSEAEPLYLRTLATQEGTLGKEHPLTLGTVNNLAALYRAQGRHVEAEALYRRVLTGLEQGLGKEHPDTLASVNNLAMLYEIQGRHAEAEPLYLRALTSEERVLGKEHPTTLATINNLAVLYRIQGRYAEARTLYDRALASQERALGTEHPDTVTTVSNLAGLYFQQHDWHRASEYWRRSTVAISVRTQRDAHRTGITGKKIRETERLSWQFSALVKAVSRLTDENSSPSAVSSREMFQTAQWALASEAAQSLAQMSARGSARNPHLAVVVRERQDLVIEWHKRDALRNATLGKETVKRDATAEAENTARLAAIDARIAEIDKRLAAEFPDYAVLASVAPSPVEEVQAQLGTDEVLVLFLGTEAWDPAPEETFIWVVSKTEVRWLRSGLGTSALSLEVQALRCGLDAAAWTAPHCAKLHSGGFSEADANAGKPLPFDHNRAHALYKALFGPVEDSIKGKHLLIVPSGPLTQLPFQVLVTAPPANGDHKAAAWFARDHALTVLPAVSSLKALRRVARPSAATKPMIGFGNPLLDGQQNHRNPKIAEFFKNRAKRARDNQQCQTTAFQRAAEFFGSHRGVTPMKTRSGLANVDLIRMQTPLPETADELCAVARDLNADVADIHLGKGASEHEVKVLSTSGQLAQYRIVHFATHGALAGELNGTSEPGLLLTPPDTSTEDDDGYLSASEIAGLKLDADWVILSACNTAAGDATGAQALSGLARAFIYAQARTLLVSHWAVDSNATVKLILVRCGKLAVTPMVGRAEALRRSMLALIDKGAVKEAHPAFWAPFVVVGEGVR